jgi:sulfite exporter TauE/SafE
MYFKTLIEGFILGLSTGTICLLTCTPIYLPYLATEKRQLKENFWKVMEISFGRFFSYLAFGALAGWFGAQIAEIDRTLYTGIAYILLSVFLVLTSLRTSKQEKHCVIPFYMKLTKSAFLMGVLTGINFCPSFLIAVSKAVDLAGVFSGIMLFMGFFFGTTLFLLPLAFTGMLASIGEMKYYARIAAIVIAVWFVGQGGWNIYHHFHQVEINKHSRILNPADPETKILLVANPADSIYFNVLSDSLFLFKTMNFSYVQMDSADITEIDKYGKNSLIILDKELYSKELDPQFQSRDLFLVENEYSITTIMNFLRTRNIRVRPNQGAHWDFTKK